MTPQAAKLKYSSCLNKDFTYLLTYAGEIGIWMYDSKTRIMRTKDIFYTSP